MKKQSGFTLIELAIVLVIIGLLLGGVLKGQELINSAKAKNMVSDFKNIQVYIYGYQDKYRALPGDDANAQIHLGTTAVQAGTGSGNGKIDGNWNSSAASDESVIFWQHVRLAGLAPGPTTIGAASTAAGGFLPSNADGGRLGVTSVSSFNGPSGLSGAFVICSGGVLGKFAKQIDVTLDDGDVGTGSVRSYADPTTGAGTGGTSGTASASWAVSTGQGAIDDSTTYNVCMAF